MLSKGPEDVHNHPGTSREIKTLQLVLTVQAQCSSGSPVYFLFQFIILAPVSSEDRFGATESAAALHASGKYYPERFFRKAVMFW